MSNPERENPYFDQFWCSPGSVKNIHSWHSGGNPPCLDYVSERLCQSCVGMIWLVWFGWQCAKSFRTILWRWYLYHSCIVWSGCQESDQTLQRTSVQCLHSIASTRVLVRVRVVTQQRSESEFKPDLQMSLWSFGHQLISIISINTLKLSLLRAYIQKAGVCSLSNILHLSQNFWLRTQNPLCVFEDCIANFITDMSKYCRKFPPIYSLLGYLVEYFKWNAGQQNGSIALYYISLLSGLGNI